MPEIATPGTEISRKILHLSSAMIALIYAPLDHATACWILLGGTGIAVAVEILRFRHAGFQLFFRRTVGFMVRPAEWDRLTGATYVLVGALLTVFLFPKRMAIIGLVITSLADSAASLVGLWLGRGEFYGKSLAGSGAFFATALVITVIGLPGQREVAFTAALAATLAEALPALRWGRFELNDNLLIPLTTAATIVLLQAR